MSRQHVQATAGIYSGAPENGPGNFAEFSKWLGRRLAFQSTNFGMRGTLDVPYQQARLMTARIYDSVDGFAHRHPDVVLCPSAPVTAGQTGLSAAMRRHLFNEVCDGRWDDEHRTFARRVRAAQDRGVLSVVRLGSEPDIPFNPYSMVDAEREFVRAFNHVALIYARTGCLCIDLSGNGSWSRRWADCRPRNELYTVFGGNFYLGTNKGTGFGSHNEVIERIDATQREAALRGKLFSIPEWGVWSERDITDTQACAFFADLTELLESFPSSGPGALFYWNSFHGKKETSLDHFPKLKQAFREYVTE